MIYVSHRGNLEGSNPELENSPEYVMKAINSGFDCEVDVWFVDGNYLLGHDEPTYEVDNWFLSNPNLWIHIKNLEATNLLYKRPKPRCFMHDRDNSIIITDGDCHSYIWTYPGKELCRDSICVMPEWNGCEYGNISGVCSDYIVEAKQTGKVDKK